MRESIKEIKLGKIKLYKSIKSEYYTIRYILGIRYYKKINLNKYFNDFQNKVSNNFFKKSLQLLTDAIIDPYGASMMKLMLNSLNVKPEYERFFYEMSDDDICIDGGANIGHFTDVILHKKATVYSFEPNPVLYKNLQQKYKNRSNVFLFDSAISTHNGEAQFSLPKCRNENYVTYSEWGSKNN